MVFTTFSFNLYQQSTLRKQEVIWQELSIKKTEIRMKYLKRGKQ